jgi:hypothetical protein
LRSIIRTYLVLVVVAGLLNIPPASGGEKPLGMIVLANSTYVDKGTAGSGADVFSGDYLKTDPGGTLRLKLGSSQLYLLSASEAILSQDGNEVRARIKQGTAGFSSAVAGQFDIETPIATIRAADGQRAFGQVTLTSSDKMLVSAYNGDLVVERNGETKIVKAGEAYNVSYAPDPTPASSSSSAPPQGSGTRARTNGHLILEAVVIIGGAALGSGLLYHYLSESDSKP